MNDSPNYVETSCMRSGWQRAAVDQAQRDAQFRAAFAQHAHQTGVLIEAIAQQSRELQLARDAYASLEQRVADLERERVATHALPEIVRHDLTPVLAKR